MPLKHAQDTVECLFDALQVPHRVCVHLSHDPLYVTATGNYG